MSDQDAIHIISTTILVFLLGIFIISTIYLFQKKQQLFHKNIEDIKLKHKQNILESQNEIQEQTFQRISREIHDNISSSLILCKLNLATLNHPGPSTPEEKIEKTTVLIGEAIRKLSNISKSLSSDLIKENGLLHALDEELDIINNTGLYKINYETKGDIVFMGAEKELVIFRIIQESLNNIIKHSKADIITLGLDYATDLLHIKISDNGSGFDLSTRYTPSKSTSTGLKNIEYRIKILEGTFEIVSQQGKGTTIKISIPKNNP